MNFKAIVSTLLLSAISLPALAQTTVIAPAQITQDVARRAAWLPNDVKQYGLGGAYDRHWATYSAQAQYQLEVARIPLWMVALAQVPDANTMFQFENMNSLNGPAASSGIANRIEQLLFFAGAAQLATPGDAATGRSLGSEGCTAAITRYVLAELSSEGLINLPSSITTSESSQLLENAFAQLSRLPNSPIVMYNVPFNTLTSQYIMPGSIMIGHKPGGTHVFAWTRVPTAWTGSGGYWSADDKIAIGNTGLAQFGAPHMILAQEFITGNDPNETQHNSHGPINSHFAARNANGSINLGSDETNVYYAESLLSPDVSFTVINFK